MLLFNVIKLTLLFLSLMQFRETKNNWVGGCFYNSVYMFICTLSSH